MLLISDASILIDIECGRLTSAMFTLSYQFAVPNILFEEELAEKHASLLGFGLICKPMDGALIAETYNLWQKHSKLSVNDLLALTLARDENSMLLTGDKALRELAEAINVETHGTIWLVEQMLKFQKITTEEAETSFLQMKNSGSRLPWNEVSKMLKRNSVDLLRL